MNRRKRLTLALAVALSVCVTGNSMLYTVAAPGATALIGLEKQEQTEDSREDVLSEEKIKEAVDNQEEESKQEESQQEESKIQEETAEDDRDKDTEQKETDDTTGEEAGKSEAEEGDKTEGEEAGKSEAEEGDKTEGEEADKSEAEEGDKTEGEEADKSEAEEGDKTEGEEAGKSEAEEGDKTEGEEAGKPEAEEGHKTEGEEAGKSEAEEDDKTNEQEPVQSDGEGSDIVYDGLEPETDEIFLPITNTEGIEMTPEKDGWLYYLQLVGEEPEYARQIKGDLWMSGFREEGLVYTGSAITQDVKIYHKNRLLQKNKDYKLAFKNHVNAKNREDANPPTMTLILTGHYEGQRPYSYTIERANINGAEMFDQGIAVNYTGTYAEPVPTVTYMGKKLKHNVHFTVSYMGNTKGDPEVPVRITYKLEGRGNFCGTKYGGEYYIVGAANNLNKATLTLSNKNIKYMGTPITESDLGITVKLKGKVLDAGLYTVELKNFDKAGTGTIMIRPSEEAKKTYAGCLTKNVKITGGVPFKNAVSVNAAVWKDTMTYDQTDAESENGFVQNTENLLLEGSVPLKEGIDYQVKYSANRKVGTIKATFTGMGKYAGQFVKSFKVVPSTDFSVMPVGDVVYAIGGAAPELVVQDTKGRTLQKGKDYTVKFSQNTSVGTVYYKVTGKGNYAKTKQIEDSFQVVLAPLDTTTTMAIADKAYTDKPGNYKSVPVLTGLNGKKLVANRDYEKNIVYELVSMVDGQEVYTTIKDGETVPVGSVVRATVTGKGNFQGSNSAVFRIYEKTKDIRRLFIKIDQQVYSGEAIEPVLSDSKGNGDIHVFLTKKDRNEGTNEQNAADYVMIESYANNTNSGKGTVFLKAYGEYGGSAKYTFVIAKKKMSFVGVSSIKCNKNRLDMQVGGKEQLDTVVLPANADEYSVYYSSNNTQVATVDSSGMVEAVGAGVTMITATVVGYNGKRLSATCYIAVTDDGKLPEKYVTPQEFGAVAGDGQDDLAAFNKAIESISYRSDVSVLWVPEGVYDVDVSNAKKLTMKSGVHVRMDDRAVIKAMPNKESNYELIWFWKVENASITGGKIVGDRDKHKGESGEWGHCIAFFESKNIVINNVDISYGWGDGIYFGSYEPANTVLNNRNISICGCNIHHNRRNNVAITSGENIVFSGCKMNNANGTDPQFGMDIEPNKGEVNPVKQIYMENCTMTGNAKAAMGIITAARDVKIVGSTFDGDFHNRACTGLSFTDCTINGDLYLIGFDAKMTNTTVTGSIIR